MRIALSKSSGHMKPAFPMRILHWCAPDDWEGATELRGWENEPTHGLASDFAQVCIQKGGACARTHSHTRPYEGNVRLTRETLFYGGGGENGGGGDGDESSVKVETTPHMPPTNPTTMSTIAITLS